MRAVPTSAALVAWTNAWLSGHIGLDEAVDAVERAAGPQVIAGLSGDSGEVSLRQGLASLRRLGLMGLRLALPAPGDPLGLPGPPSLNEAAVEAGEAVIVDLPTPAGLVPAEDRRGSSYAGVRWSFHAANRAAGETPSLSEAEHELTLAVRETTETLVRLDVAGWRPEVGEALHRLRDPGQVADSAAGLAPGYPQRAYRIAALTHRLAVVVSLALEDEGGAVTGADMTARRDTLRDLERAVRRAQVAAYNCVLSPVRP